MADELTCRVEHPSGPRSRRLLQRRPELNPQRRKPPAAGTRSFGRDNRETLFGIDSREPSGKVDGRSCEGGPKSRARVEVRKQLGAQG